MRGGSVRCIASFGTARHLVLLSLVASLILTTLAQPVGRRPSPPQGDRDRDDDGGAPPVATDDRSLGDRLLGGLASAGARLGGQVLQTQVNRVAPGLSDVVENFQTITGGSGTDDDSDDANGDDEDDDDEDDAGAANKGFPQDPASRLPPNTTFQDMRSAMDLAKLMQGRAWDAKSPQKMTTAEKQTAAMELQGIAPRAGTAIDPGLAGLICSPDGVSIQSVDGTIFYSSQVESPRGAGTATKCLWILDFPPGMPDGTLIALEVHTFSSASPATLKAFSGMQTCQDDDSLFMKYHISEGGFSSLESIQDAYAFIPVRDKSITIEMEIESEMGGGVTAFTEYELDLFYYPLWPRYPPSLKPMRLPPMNDGQPYLQAPVGELMDDGVLPDRMSLYNSKVRTFGQLVDSNDVFDNMTGVERGVYIVNNPDFVSLDGIQDKVRSVADGPIVISNNPNLHMPIAGVLDWLNSIEGNLSSVDLTFNDFHGQVPESYCELIKKVPGGVDLSQNINICGEVPSCLMGVKKDVLYNSGIFFDDYNNFDPDDESSDESLREKLVDDDYGEDLSNKLQSFMQLWGGGNNVGSSCDALNLTTGFSDDIYGCSPLGYTGRLQNSGELAFTSLTIEMQGFKDTSCAWQMNLRNKEQRETLGSRSVMILDFNSFYTSINGKQGICNDFSSGHNFYNGVLNSETTDEFVVSVYNETYKRGLDMFQFSGSEMPQAYALKVRDTYDQIKIHLKKKTIMQMQPELAQSMNRTVEVCGDTSVNYTFVEPITTLANLTRFVNQNRNTVTGVLSKSIVLSSCEAVNGSKIEDLSALKDVTKITGNLIIIDCPTLKSLKGASKLQNISKSLIINLNSNLKNVSGLSSLEYVGRSFILDENPKLRSFAGLEKLKEIGGALKVKASGMKSLKGLGGLESIGGQMIILQNIHLKSLEGLYSLTRIGMSMTVKYNIDLKSLSGLHLLQEIGGSLDVQLNSKLMNLTGLENLKTVRGSFGIFNNPEMTNIEQLQKLESVSGSFLIGSNTMLTSIELPVVKAIGSPMPSETLIVDSPDQQRRLMEADNGNKTLSERCQPEGICEESSNHIFAVQFNPLLQKLNISEDIERLPWNIMITNNEFLSGFLPWNLLTTDFVRQANMNYNNFSGPIDPNICTENTTIQALLLHGNKGICGNIPQSCTAMQNSHPIEFTDDETNLRKPCKNTDPPVCEIENTSPVSFTDQVYPTVTDCAVFTSEYSSTDMDLPFLFPKYKLQDNLPKYYNTTIQYQFGVGTKPFSDNVNAYERMDNSMLQSVGPLHLMLSYTWNIEDRHISLVNGQTYYVTVSAQDLTGVTGQNITSNGTLIDVMPPNVTDAKARLEIDDSGHYRIEWHGFESMSGIDFYRIGLYRDAKKQPFNNTQVPGNVQSLEGMLPAGTVTNGTLFAAEITGVSKAGLKSAPVRSPAVMPAPDNSKKKYTVIGVAVGITLGCLLIAAIVAFFVMRHLKKQKEKAKEEKWLRKLNNSVYTFLQGTGTSAGKLSSEEGSVCLSSDKTVDSDNSKDCVFVFTDIQSSTKLCEQDADAYLLLQEAHDEVMRNALAEVGGHEVDTEGDAFQCMFPNVVTSLLFCFKVQEDLLEYDWPPSVLALHECGKVKSTLHRNKYIWAGPRVRMAVHFARGGTYLAKSHPTTRRVAYGGQGWKTAMTLSDVGHGGQILVSEQAWRHLTAFGEEGAAGYPIFEDLGRYQIEDFEICAPMRILQVSPARSSVSERIFPTLRDVDMLDAGHGMNIVPSIDGKAAIVCAIIEPSRFVHIIENFITVISKREAASNNAPIDESEPWKKASVHDADTVSVTCRSPVFVPDYDNSAQTTKRTLDRSLSHQENREHAVELMPMDALGFREAGKTIYFTDEHQQAVDIVCTSIEALVSQFGGYLIRTVEGVDVPQQVMVIAFKSSSSAVRFTLAAQTTLMEYPWPKSINEAFGNSKVSTLSRDGTPLFNGPCVAMSAHVGLIEKFSLFGSKKLQRSMSSDHKVSYKYAGILPALELAHIASGGQTVLSSSFFDSKWQKGLSLSQTQVTDLGVHDVRYFSQPEKLIEILPKILQDRSDFFLPLNSQRILSVGAQNAPGAHGEPVALVFTYPRVARAFQKSDIANQAVDNFSEAVRILLARYNGYESQEVGTGCFFLSFPSIEDAVAWGIHLQLVLRRSDWNNSESFLRMNGVNKSSTPKEMETNIYEVFKRNSSDKSSQPSPGVLVDDDHGASTGDRTGPDDMEDTLFSFASTHHSFPNMSLMMRHLVLVQIGICYGMPTKVTPHVQTGRADYFGPIVNLSARVAKGTKPGDVHLSSYTDLNTDDVLKPGPEHISWRGDRSVGPSSGADGGGAADDGQQACYLKGMEFANEGKWVDVSLNDEGYFAFKGVKNKRKVLSVKVASDPFGYSANSTPNV